MEMMLHACLPSFITMHGAISEFEVIIKRSLWGDLLLWSSWKRSKTHEGIRPCDAKRKKMGALDSCLGLVGPHQQSIPQLLSLVSRRILFEKPQAIFFKTTSSPECAPPAGWSSRIRPTPILGVPGPTGVTPKTSTKLTSSFSSMRTESKF